MARPKIVFTEALAERAQADLDALDSNRAAFKLRAIVSATKHPVAQAAEIMGVAAETVWRWGAAYAEQGVGALCPKPKKPRASKLTKEQKAQALKWIDEAKAPSGRHAHWTLEKLCQAFIDEFNVELSINAIWAWLRKEGKKLKVPRPKHYKADEAAQEAFKKNRRASGKEPGRHSLLFRRRALRQPAVSREVLGHEGRAPSGQGKDRLRQFLRLQRRMPLDRGELHAFPAVREHSNDEHVSDGAWGVAGRPPVHPGNGPGRLAQVKGAESAAKHRDGIPAGLFAGAEPGGAAMGLAEAEHDTEQVFRHARRGHGRGR